MKPQDYNGRKSRSIEPDARTYRALFNGVDDGILVADLGSKEFVIANHSMCKMMGYSEEAFLGLSVFDIHPEDDLDYVLSVFEAQARGEIELARNIPCLRKDGSVFFADIKTRKITIKDADFNLGFFTDITERKRLEDEARAREERIRRHQSAILRLLSNSTILEGDFREALRMTAEIASETMDTERTGIWMLSEDGSEIVCAEQYERSLRRHSEGESLRTEDYPEYFKTIKTARAINADDIHTDPRINEFTAGYLVPLGITSLMDAGIRVHDKIVGIVSFEHTGEQRKWKPEEITFAGEIADQVAKAMIAREKLDALDALRERESQITGILRTAPIGIGLVKNRVFVWVSEKTLDMTGYTKEEVIGRKVRMFYESEDEYNRVGEVTYGQIRESGTGAVDTKWVKNDGTAIEININLSPINPDDHSEGIIFSALDITERKQAEEALRVSETKFRALAENTSDITVIIDVEGIYSYVSPAVEKLFGYEPKEVLEKQQDKFIHEEDWPAVKKVFSETVDKPYLSIRMPHFRAQHSNGEWRILEGIATYMPDIQGVNGIVINCRDVTERRNIEQALEESEQFLANVFNSIQDGISVLDRDLRILRVNHVMNEWYSDFLPLEARTCYKCYHGLDKPCENCPTIRCFKTGKTERDTVPGPTGSPVKWIELFSFPFRDPETGEVAGAVEYVRDITAKKEAEEIITSHRDHLEELVEERTLELKQAQEQLIASERLAVLGQFAGSIAHEIRNPLGVISNSAYYLKMVTPKDNSKIARHLEIISDQIRHTTGIIDSILKLTRMKEPLKEELDICDLLLTMIKAEKFSGRIKVNSEIPQKPITVSADKEQLRISFKNILKNAVQAIDGEGSINVKVEPDSFNGGDWVVLRFIDSGPGISEKQIEKIFQPLFTTKVYGIGFGLSIVKTVIEKHGGDITAESEPGKGATFTVRLPVKPGEG